MNVSDRLASPYSDTFTQHFFAKNDDLSFKAGKSNIMLDKNVVSLRWGLILKTIYGNEHSDSKGRYF